MADGERGGVPLANEEDNGDTPFGGGTDWAEEALEILRGVENEESGDGENASNEELANDEHVGDAEPSGNGQHLGNGQHQEIDLHLGDGLDLGIGGLPLSNSHQFNNDQHSGNGPGNGQRVDDVHFVNNPSTANAQNLHYRQNPGRSAYSGNVSTLGNSLSLDGGAPASTNVSPTTQIARLSSLAPPAFTSPEYRQPGLDRNPIQPVPPPFILGSSDPAAQQRWVEQPQDAEYWGRISRDLFARPVPDTGLNSVPPARAGRLGRAQNAYSQMGLVPTPQAEQSRDPRLTDIGPHRDYHYQRRGAISLDRPIQLNNQQHPVASSEPGYTGVANDTGHGPSMFGASQPRPGSSHSSVHTNIRHERYPLIDSGPSQLNAGPSLAYNRMNNQPTPQVQFRSINYNALYPNVAGAPQAPGLPHNTGHRQLYDTGFHQPGSASQAFPGNTGTRHLLRHPHFGIGSAQSSPVPPFVTAHQGSARNAQQPLFGTNSLQPRGTTRGASHIEYAGEALQSGGPVAHEGLPGVAGHYARAPPQSFLTQANSLPRLQAPPDPDSEPFRSSVSMPDFSSAMTGIVINRPEASQQRSRINMPRNSRAPGLDPRHIGSGIPESSVPRLTRIANDAINGNQRGVQPQDGIRIDMPQNGLASGSTPRHIETSRPGSGARELIRVATEAMNGNRGGAQPQNDIRTTPHWTTPMYHTLPSTRPLQSSDVYHRVHVPAYGPAVPFPPQGSNQSRYTSAFTPTATSHPQLSQPNSFQNRNGAQEFRGRTLSRPAFNERPPSRVQSERLPPSRHPSGLAPRVLLTDTASRGPAEEISNPRLSNLSWQLPGSRSSPLFRMSHGQQDDSGSESSSEEGREAGGGSDNNNGQQNSNNQPHVRYLTSIEYHEDPSLIDQNLHNKRYKAYIADKYEDFSGDVTLYEIIPQVTGCSWAQAWLDNVLEGRPLSYNVPTANFPVPPIWNRFVHQSSGFIWEGNQRSLVILHDATNPFGPPGADSPGTTTIGVYGYHWFEHDWIHWITFAPNLSAWINLIASLGHLKKIKKWTREMVATERRFHRAYWLAANRKPLSTLLHQKPVEDAVDPEQEEESGESEKSDSKETGQTNECGHVSQYDRRSAWDLVVGGVERLGIMVEDHVVVGDPECSIYNSLASRQ